MKSIFLTTISFCLFSVAVTFSQSAGEILIHKADSLKSINIDESIKLAKKRWMILGVKQPFS